MCAGDLSTRVSVSLLVENTPTKDVFKRWRGKGERKNLQATHLVFIPRVECGALSFPSHFSGTQRLRERKVDYPKNLIRVSYSERASSVHSLKGRHKPGAFTTHWDCFVIQPRHRCSRRVMGCPSDVHSACMRVAAGLGHFFWGQRRSLSPLCRVFTPLP